MNDEQMRVLIEADNRSKSNEERIDKIEDRYELLYEMNNNIAQLALQTQYIIKDLAGVKNDVETIKAKPNRLMESIVEKIIMVLIGAALGVFLSGVGM